MGIQKNNLNFISPLSELTRQQTPLPTFSLQRQILCLTNLGLHIFFKKRPIDYLYQFLKDNKINEINEFFAFYGCIEASAMCLGESEDLHV